VAVSFIGGGNWRKTLTLKRLLVATPGRTVLSTNETDVQDITNVFDSGIKYS
jgi:hypothetical protein